MFLFRIANDSETEETMQVVHSGSVPVVTTTIDELPLFVAFAHKNDFSFYSCERRIYEADPIKIVVPTDHVGFKFYRRPIVQFLIGGEHVEVRGNPLAESKEYFCDSRLLTKDTFLLFASANMCKSRFQDFLAQLQLQDIDSWQTVLVVTVDRTNNEWKYFRYNPDKMVALDRDGNIVVEVLDVNSTESH